MVPSAVFAGRGSYRIPGFAISSTRSWFLNSRRAGRASGAFIGSLLCVRRDQYRALLDLALVDGREYAVDVVERVRLDERFDLDLAVEHEVEGLRVGLGRAAPVADGARIERHQIGQAHLDLVHRKADDRQRCAVNEQAVRRQLTGCRAGAFEDAPLGRTQAILFREVGDSSLDRLGVLRAAVDRQRRAVARQGNELVVVDIDGNDIGAERVSDLDTVAAYAARTNDDGDASRLDACTLHGLVWGGQRIGDDRNIGERESRTRKTYFVHFAQPATGDHDVRRKAALDVVARHFLPAADRAESASAKVALAAGQDGGHAGGRAAPALGTRTCVDHAAADFVSQRQRERVVGPNTVVEITEVGVTHAATSDVDDDFPRARLCAKRRSFQRRIHRGH